MTKKTENIELVIRHLKSNDENQYWWNKFKKWHYLSANLMESADCFVVFWKNNPVGFMSLRTAFEARPRAFYSHRMVVLPDYQGMGFGSRMSRWLGEYCARRGGILCRKVGNYKLQKFFEKDPYHQIVAVAEDTFKPSMIDSGRWRTIPEGITDPANYKGPFKIIKQTTTGRTNDFWVYNVNSKKVSIKYLGYDYVHKPHRYLVIDGTYTLEKIESLLDEYCKPEFYNFVCCGDRTNLEAIKRITGARNLRMTQLDSHNRVHPKHFTEKVLYIHPTGDCPNRHIYGDYIKEEIIVDEGSINSDDSLLF